MNVIEIPLTDLHTGSWEAPRDLLQSIAQVGQLEPIIVGPVTYEEEGEIVQGYKVEDGRRRVACLKELGFETVKAVLRDEDLLSPVVTLAANVHSPNPMSEAKALQELRDMGLSEEAVLQGTNLDRGRVKMLDKYLRLAPQFQSMLEAGKLTKTGALELAQLSKPEQSRAWEHACILAEKDNPPVRLIKEAVRGQIAQKQPVMPVPLPRREDGQQINLMALATALRQLCQNVNGDQAEKLVAAAKVLERMR